MRAAGAHMSTCPGPLQQLVMCACHRTSPAATSLACDGLYSATSAEQRGQNLPKLMCSMAGHCASGATPPMNFTPACSSYSPCLQRLKTVRPYERSAFAPLVQWQAMELISFGKFRPLCSAEVGE